LDAEQKTVTVVDSVAPADIVTKNYRMVDATAVPRGIAYATLSGEQPGYLINLIRHYVERTADEVSAQTDLAAVSANDSHASCAPVASSGAPFLFLSQMGLHAHY
jgi:hypothetical protein